jgi:hypothetical protein
MTTGWLGGLLNYDTSAGAYTQLGDLSQMKLIKLMWLSTMEANRDAVPSTTAKYDKGPFRTDGIFYSTQAIFGLVRSRLGGGLNANTTSTQGRWIHNGSIISYELGFLAPGPLGNTEYSSTAKTSANPVSFGEASIAGVSTGNDATGKIVGPGMGLYYDARLQGLLKLESGDSVKIKPSGGYTQVGR